MFKNRKVFTVVLTFALSVFNIPSTYGFETLGTAGGWKISGADGQCQASKPLNPSVPSEIAIGISLEGTYLTFQNLRWSLSSTATNMMPVRLYFDKTLALRTEALLISQIRAFQVFVWLTDVPDTVFWEELLDARSMKIIGKFKPGRAKVKLTDTNEIVPLLKSCAQRYLPDVKMPF